MGVSSSLPNDPPTEMARTPRTPLLAAPLAECDPEVLDDLRKRMLEYDYIRYTYTDLNGAQRGITVPARAAQNSIERGVQVVEGKIRCRANTCTNADLFWSRPYEQASVKFKPK